MGRRRRRPRLKGADASRPVARRICATAPSGPEFEALPFTSLYLLEDEWAAEIANRTMHGVMHVGWVRDENGGYRGQMAVLVKPNGLSGNSLHGRDQAVPPPDRLPGRDQARSSVPGGRSVVLSE